MHCKRCPKYYDLFMASNDIKNALQKYLQVTWLIHGFTQLSFTVGAIRGINSLWDKWAAEKDREWDNEFCLMKKNGNWQEAFTYRGNLRASSALSQRQTWPPLALLGERATSRQNVSPKKTLRRYREFLNGKFTFSLILKLIQDIDLNIFYIVLLEQLEWFFVLYQKLINWIKFVINFPFKTEYFIYSIQLIYIFLITYLSVFIRNISKHKQLLKINTN